MQNYERDFFISRIRCGYFRFKYGDESYIYTPPSNDLAYQAQSVYKDYYELGVEDGLLSDEDIVNNLHKFKLWTDLDEERLKKTYPNDMDNLKVAMYQQFDQPQEVGKMRKYLDSAKQELMRMFEVRHQFDYLSCHGSAIFARWQFIIQNCVKQENGNEPDWNNVSISSLLSCVNDEMLDESQLRELSRTDPWATIWSVNKKNNNLFGVPSCDLTDDQKKLVCWSMLFDSVAETENPPSDEIILDDDCFDGWLINRRREQKKESDRDLVENRMGRNASASEVFIPVASAEDTNELIPRLDGNTITNMNDAFTKHIIKNRIEVIEQSEGPVLDLDFQDVKLKVAMEINNRK